MMKCMICRHGEASPGITTVTLERDGRTFVFRRVPARVCDNCGEAYVEQAAAARLLQYVDEAVRNGVHVDIRDYVAA